MTDRDLIAKRLAFIETCLHDLAHARPGLLDTDLRERRFVEHTLQLAIQAAIDVASHVVSDERLGEPETNRALFEILARHGWLPADLAMQLGNMAGFRNILVHGYAEVNLAVVRDVLAYHLDDLGAFVAELRQRMP